MKVIKVGQYRMFFLLASIASLVFFGASQNLIVLAVSLGVLFGWIIFEINVVLQGVLGVQRMLAYIMQSKEKATNDPMEIEKPEVKLADINSGQGKSNEA
jgi:hypothetical protein